MSDWTSNPAHYLPTGGLIASEAWRYTSDPMYGPHKAGVRFEGIGLQRLEAWLGFVQNTGPLIEWVAQALQNYTQTWVQEGRQAVLDTGIHERSGDLLSDYFVEIGTANTFGTGAASLEVEFGSTATHRGTHYPELLDEGFTHRGGTAVGPYRFFTRFSEQLRPELKA